MCRRVKKLRYLLYNPSLTFQILCRGGKWFKYLPGCRVWPELPALEWKVWKSEGGEPEDPEVHCLKRQSLLSLVEADPVEAGRGPVSLLLVPANNCWRLEPKCRGRKFQVDLNYSWKLEVKADGVKVCLFLQNFVKMYEFSTCRSFWSSASWALISLSISSGVFFTLEFSSGGAGGL